MSTSHMTRFLLRSAFVATPFLFVAACSDARPEGPSPGGSSALDSATQTPGSPSVPDGGGCFPTDGGVDGAAYEPCEGKACGAPCTLCAPNDPSCAETSVLKFCDEQGSCGAKQPVCQGPRPGEEGGICGGFAGFVCNPGLECADKPDYPDDDSTGTCQKPGLWFTYVPRQCDSNPWSPSTLDTEPQAVHTYYQRLGIELAYAGFLHDQDPLPTCMACSCPRGDRLLVRVADRADRGRLAGLGFTPTDPGRYLAYTSVQCGNNPWELNASGSSRDVHRLFFWAALLPAEVVQGGFADETPGTGQCDACTCPRGDIAILVPKGPADRTILRTNGFHSLP
jgi:hypothetical protein